jgi:hypothetical protein
MNPGSFFRGLPTMNPSLPTTFSSDVPLWGRTGLRQAATDNLPWLWHGYLAPGNITLLTSQWKTGKTTLVSVLLARMQGGGPLGGGPVLPGRAVVVSEEGPAHWLPRADKLGLGEHVGFLCRPFRQKPTAEQWAALIDHLAELRARSPLDLVVIDPLASFLPGRDEGNAGVMLEALLRLQKLTAAGLAVLVLHHPRKGEPKAGQMARGSGALSGYVDVLLEMTCLSPLDGDRRRLLRAWSRHEETPRQKVIELTEDGTDYLSLGDLEGVENASQWEVLAGVLREAGRKLTRKEVLKDWPRGAKPDELTLYRWLERGVKEGKVKRQGRGCKGEPFRYWLPEVEAGWDPELGLAPLDIDPMELLQAATRVMRVSEAVRRKMED